MLPEPLCQGLGRPIRQERDGPPALQIDQHRPIGPAFPQGEIVHPQRPGCRQDGERQPTQPAQQGVPTHRQVPRVAEAYPRPPAQCDAEREEVVRQPEGAPGPGRSDRGQPFREDAAPAVAIVAEPLAHAEL